MFTCQFCLLSMIAYSSSGAGAYSGTGTGTGLYSSNYGSNDIYGSQFPYVGGYVGGYVGNGYFPQAVPPYGFPGYGFPVDLQNFIHSQYHHLQSQFNKIQRLFTFFYLLLFEKKLQLVE